jgi:hypothetical protein
MTKPSLATSLSIVAASAAAVSLSGRSLAPAESSLATPPARVAAQLQSAHLFVSGLGAASGSTVGPDGALYVTHGVTGTISRVDPGTGARTTFASGLPPALIPGLGGVMDVAFIGRTAYALVTLVGSDIGGTNVVGIYRVDGPSQFTVIADIGQFSIDNPPPTAFDVPSGLQFALDRYHHGFLVTDGHHNRVLRVSVDGAITKFMEFDNIVPTGLSILGNRVYMAEAGPVPHLPEDGRVVLLRPKKSLALEVASGARLLVDVEWHRGRALYALSQGELPPGGIPATPALPNTGSLVEANADGTFTVVASPLNQPTSLEFISDVAYIVTLGGDIWTVSVEHHGR